MLPMAAEYYYNTVFCLLTFRTTYRLTPPDAESKIVESKEKLAETDHKRIENQREFRKHIEFLEKQIAEQGDTFQRALHALS